MFRRTPGRATLFFVGLVSLINEACNQNLVYNQLGAEERDAFAEPSLRCYDCNSAYDYRCADPFDSYSIGILNCSSRKTPEHLIDHLHPERKVYPIVCRKTVQKIEGHTRVIRGCGYIRDETDNRRCVRRTGTSGVEVHYCGCTGDLCNAGNSVHQYSVITFVTVLAILSM